MTIDEINAGATRVMQVLDGQPIARVYAGVPSISTAYVTDLRMMIGAVHAVAAVAKFEAKTGGLFS